MKEFISNSNIEELEDLNLEGGLREISILGLNYF